MDWATVDTCTLSGLKRAERLHTTGWVTFHAGLCRITFFRKTPRHYRYSVVERDGLFRVGGVEVPKPLDKPGM